jgi:hypothetical protein
MKRNWCIVISCLVILFVIGLVNAQDVTGSIARGSSGLADIIVAAFGPFFAALFGGDSSILFEKILIFLVIISIVYMVIRKMPVFQENGAIIFIVTISVSLLATRFFVYSDNAIVWSVILPYSVLGVTLSAFLPLIIGFFFIHQAAGNSAFIRKMFWIFFIVVFIAMWDLRYDEVGGFAWVYFWSAIVSLLFFLFDGTIRRAMIKSQMDATGDTTRENFARRIRRELGELETDKTRGYVTDSQYNRMKRDLSKQLKNLAKH